MDLLRLLFGKMMTGVFQNNYRENGIEYLFGKCRLSGYAVW